MLTEVLTVCETCSDRAAHAVSRGLTEGLGPALTYTAPSFLRLDHHDPRHAHSLGGRRMGARCIGRPPTARCHAQRHARVDDRLAKLARTHGLAPEQAQECVPHVLGTGK